MARVKRIWVSCCFEIDIEHYQGPEDFYPINPPPLEGIDITVEMPDGTLRPGLSINLQE
ncbi:Uncharacterised protein [Raoultella ornithinolytica]|nr:Uncharacterised protein [Raoultella ornithinolytica]